VRCWPSDRRSPAALATLSVVALAGLASGCGKEKRDFRVEKLNPLVKRAGEERATLAAVLRGSRPGRARDAGALREQLARVVGVLRRIAGLNPPDGVDGTFRRYTRANTAFAAALRRFVDAFAAGDDSGQRDAAERTRTTLATAQRAQVQLQHALR
jgi:cytochrome c556